MKNECCRGSVEPRGPKAQGIHITKNQYHFLKQGFIVPPFEGVIHHDRDGRIARA